MSRIATTFESLQRDGRKALIPFITAGDPHADSTVEIMWAMADAGADVIELGVPFSDPMADGPVIQRAAERALTGGAEAKWTIFAGDGGYPIGRPLRNFVGRLAVSKLAPLEDRSADHPNAS